jgi:hypothetical protein
MPTYEFENPVTGERYEEYREVRDRDKPARPGFFRRTVPSRVFAVTGGGADCPIEGVVGFEKALKYAEQSGDLAKAQKQGTIKTSTKALKETWRAMRHHTDQAKKRRSWLGSSSTPYALNKNVDITTRS